MNNFDYETLSFKIPTISKTFMLDELRRMSDKIIYLWFNNGKDFPRINKTEKDMSNQYIFSAYEFAVINDINIETDNPEKYSLLFFSYDELMDFKHINEISIDEFNKYIELLKSFNNLLKKNKEIIEKKKEIKDERNK